MHTDAKLVSCYRVISFSLEKETSCVFKKIVENAQNTKNIRIHTKAGLR